MKRIVLFVAVCLAFVSCGVPVAEEEAKESAIPALNASPADFELWEVANLHEQLSAINDYIVNQLSSSVLVNIEDTAAVNRLFEQAYRNGSLDPGVAHHAWLYHSPLEEAGQCELLFIGGSNALLDGTHVTMARQDFDRSNGYTVALKFDEEGTAQLAKITNEYLGKMLAIVVKGEVIAMPAISSEITNGRMSISANFSQADAQAIAAIFDKE